MDDYPNFIIRPNCNKDHERKACDAVREDAASWGVFPKE